MWNRSKRRAPRTAAAIVVSVIALLNGSCASPTLARPSDTAHAPSGSPARASTATEAKTAATLIRVATTFNNDFGANNDGPVYARWDSRSQAIISGAEFVRRHEQCATAPQAPAHVQTATRGPAGAWLVRYSIGGQEFTDYWYYMRGRWAFDLILSNPQAVKLYRLSGPAYAAAVGCTR